jgi:malonyl-CoA decarboxylase
MKALPAKERSRLLAQLRECAEGLGGEVSARQRAARLAESYLKLPEAGRHDFLRLIALEFGPEPKRVARAHEAWQAAIGTPAQWDAEAALRAAMRSSRIRILTQFNALPQGVKFLVDLRAELLRFLERDPELAALDRELEARLTAWFDVGFLELQRITWSAPASLLEKLIEYEAVHEIRSWADLKNRLDSDRRLYAFFHPRMPQEPLIFVEVALTDRLADNVQALLDESAPLFDARHADTAIFYSISNTQAGLRGVSFGNFLLKRVVDDLQRDFPRLKTFATLSPIPQLAAWLKRNPEALKAAGVGLDAQTLAAGDWADDRDAARRLRGTLAKLAARYLTQAKSKDRPISPFDPVARFHLGNGARIERINPLADTSAKGFKQSFGLMVNYVYEPDEIEGNVETHARDGTIAMSAAVRRLAR